VRRIEFNLKAQDLADVRCDGYHRNHPSSRAKGRDVRTVIADDDDGPHFVSLGPLAGLKIKEPDVSAPHQGVSPSATVEFHKRESTDSFHSVNAMSYSDARSADLSRAIARCSTADRDSIPARSANSSRKATSWSGMLTLSFTYRYYPGATKVATLSSPEGRRGDGRILLMNYAGGGKVTIAPPSAVPYVSRAAGVVLNTQAT